MKKYRNTKISSAVIFTSVVAISSVALAGDVDVIGSSNPVFEVVSAYSGSAHYRAVHGELSQKDGWGYGGYFVGGYAGLRGKATREGSGMRYGVIGEASGGGSGNRGVYGKAISGPQRYAGYFDGVVYSTGGYQSSDEILKDEIVDLTGSLDQVMELEPKSFRYRTEEHPKKGLPEGYHMGLIAQDVEGVLPDLIKEVAVTEDEESEGKNGNPKTILAINYVGLIPVLIGAIQEQQEQIADLQEQVAGCGCR